MARKKANSTKNTKAVDTVTTETEVVIENVANEGVQQTLELTKEAEEVKPAPKKRGRKPGSKNKPKTATTTTTKKVEKPAKVEKSEKTAESQAPAPARKRGRPRKVVPPVEVTETVAVVETPAKVKEAPVKSTKKKTSIETNICYQVPGKEINEAAIYDWIKFVWTSELGRKESDIKSISVYLKPAENAIYYVVNNDYAGKLDF